VLLLSIRTPELSPVNDLLRNLSESGIFGAGEDDNRIIYSFPWPYDPDQVLGVVQENYNFSGNEY
jgi:hypothetical protein